MLWRIWLKVLGRRLLLREEERVSQEAGSDPELPECLHFTVAPCGTARHWVLECADCLAASGAKEAFAVDGDDVEAHVIGAVKSDYGFFSEGFGQVVFQQISFLFSQEKEGRSFSVVALGAD